MEKRESLPSHAVQALQAHNSSKASAGGQDQVPKRTEDIKSLNQLLQWATAHSAEGGGGGSGGADAPQAGGGRSGGGGGCEVKPEDREWLDAAFPDMYAGIRDIVRHLEENDALTSDDRIDMLEELQEYFLDLNYATNIDKIGALQPILTIASSPSAAARERATAIWILGTCMQHLDDVRTLFLQRDVHRIIATALQSHQPDVVRAKAVMAASALLRHPTARVTDAFDKVNGPALLRDRLADPNPQTRRRAHFFLQHAPNTGNHRFVDDVARDRNAVAAFAATLPHVDAEDFGEVEAAVGALSVLAASHAQSLLQVAPELPGLVDDLASRCNDDELVRLVHAAADRLS